MTRPRSPFEADDSEPRSRHRAVVVASGLTLRLLAGHRARVPRREPRARRRSRFASIPARHLKLRLACAVDGRSAQQIVTDALDRLLTDMPELDAMAEKAKRKG